MYKGDKGPLQKTIKVNAENTKSSIPQPALPSARTTRKFTP